MEGCVVGVRNGGGLGSSYVAYGRIGNERRDPVNAPSQLVASFLAASHLPGEVAIDGALVYVRVGAPNFIRHEAPRRLLLDWQALQNTGSSLVLP